MTFSSLQKTFAGKSVLLTGHTGFKGAWMTMLLHQLGAQVWGFALKPTHKNDLFNTADCKALCHHALGDVRRAAAVDKAVAASKPDFVFHFAAQALVIDSYRQPLKTYATNVMGTANVLHAMRQAKKRCTVVVVTTDKVYENLETEQPYAEQAALGGHDPYSNSKACAELVASSFRNSFFNAANFEKHGISISTARSGNVIGGGDWSANRLMPDMARAWKRGRKAAIRNPDSVRPWQHVLDPLMGYLQLAAAQSERPLLFSEAFNFGPQPDDRKSVIEMAQQAAQAWGKAEIEVIKSSNAVHEAGLLRLDIAKATTALGWKPLLNASEAVQWTMGWYANAEGVERAYTQRQMDEYLQRL